MGRKVVKEVEFSDLSSMVDNVGLFEVESKGDIYTWFNKQTKGAIYSRIEKFIGNMGWFVAKHQ